MANATLDGVALVTGGARRIGAAICEALATAGATVVVHAHRSTADAESLATRLGGHVVAGDLAKPAVAEGLVQQAAAAAGAPVRYVVNNASRFPQHRLADATYDDLDAMMRLHAWAPLAISRAAAGQGANAVVNLVDTRIAGHDPRHMPYLLSKQALWHLTRTLARELAPMRVNAVAPGPILAPTAPDGAAAAPDATAELQAAVGSTLLARVGRPDEVAHAVRFLLENEYITGDTVFVDGGRHARY